MFSEQEVTRCLDLMENIAKHDMMSVGKVQAILVVRLTREASICAENLERIAIALEEQNKLRSQDDREDPVECTTGPVGRNSS